MCGDTPAHELTELHIRTLCESWKARLGRATRYLRTRALYRLVNHIAKLTGRGDLAAAIIRTKRPQPRGVIATPEEIAALLHHAAPWLRTIILLALHAGLRRSDCLRVAPIHYHAEKKIISIEQKKTGRVVAIPATPMLAANLERIEITDPAIPFYEAQRGKPLRGTALDDHWRNLKKKAQVNPDLWIHDLRRTAAVSLYQLTKDLTAVEAFLGHNSLGSTCEYLEHKDPAKLKPYLDQIWKPKTVTIQ